MNYDFVKQQVKCVYKWRNGLQLVRAVVIHSDLIYIPMNLKDLVLHNLNEAKAGETQNDRRI